MANKSTDIQINTQSQQNLVKTYSTLSIQSSVPTSPSNCDNQKLFHRKPSFKYYERKQKKDSNPQNKICYISPQKSQIFKKYTPYRPSQTELNSSFITNNSSEISFHDDTRKSFKYSKPAVQLENSRSILNEINNIKTQDVFRTPKNIKNDQSFFMSSSNLKRMSFNRAKIQDSTNSSQTRTDFDKDFQTLFQTKNPQYQISKKSNAKWFQRKESLKNFESKQDQNFINQEIHMLNMQLNILKESLEQLNIKYNGLEIQKNQLEDSSKIFLTEIKTLQLDNQTLSHQNEKAQQLISQLKNQLFQKGTKINELSISIESLKKLNNFYQQKINDQAINENYKALYFEVNEKLKYLDVENSILKKFLDQKKEEQKKVQKLQAANKKLLSKNKFLLKQIQELEEELQNLQLQGKGMKQGTKDMQERPKSKNSQMHENFKSSKTPSFILQRVCKSPRNSSKNQKQQDNIYENEIVSSGSLQFSFELSPQKSYPSSRFKEEKQELSFRTPHKCFN